MIAFVHIPKTAGGTLASMLIAAFSRQEVERCPNYLRNPEKTAAFLARPRVARASAVVGRVPYGLYRRHLPADTRYVTFVREPVDRVLSYYYRHVHRPDFSPARREELGKAVSLEEGLRLAAPQLQPNLAARFLSEEVGSVASASDESLEATKENLRGFACVGLQERFWESVVLLGDALDVELPPVVDRHVGHSRPTVDEIPEAQRKLITEQNRLDAELYELATGLFDEIAEAYGRARLDAEAERLRRRAAARSEAELDDAHAWLDRELASGAELDLASRDQRRDILVAAKAAGISSTAVRRVWDRSPTPTTAGFSSD